MRCRFWSCPCFLGSVSPSFPDRAWLAQSFISSEGRWATVDRCSFRKAQCHLGKLRAHLFTSDTAWVCLLPELRLTAKAKWCHYPEPPRERVLWCLCQQQVPLCRLSGKIESIVGTNATYFFSLSSLEQIHLEQISWGVAYTCASSCPYKHPFFISRFIIVFGTNHIQWCTVLLGQTSMMKSRSH